MTTKIYLVETNFYLPEQKKAALFRQGDELVFVLFDFAITLKELVPQAILYK